VRSGRSRHGHVHRIRRRASAIAWLEAIGWQIAHGPEIAPDMVADERRDHGDVVLAQRLRDALARLNPTLLAEALDDAFRKFTIAPSAMSGRGGSTW
jgi:type I site-specific restriction-modification system R (restriction) subunit